MKKSLIFLVAGVLIVLSVTFASYIVLSRFRPEREIQKMLFTMTHLSSVHQESGFSWSRQNGETRINTTLYLSSDIQQISPTVIDHATRFRVVHLSKEDTYQDLSGELRSIGGQSYLTYNAPGPDVPGIDFKEETWVSFQAGELPSWGAILPELNAPLEPLFSKDLWTSGEIEQARSLFSSADVFPVRYNGLTELIEGANTRIIDATVDQQAMYVFLLDLIRAKEGREPNDEERLVGAMQATQLSRLTIRFWIGTEDHRLYRVQAAGAFEEEATTQLIPVDIRIDFNGFNKEYAFSVPETSLSFNDVLGLAFGELPASDQESQKNDDTLVNESTARLPLIKIDFSSDADEDGLDLILERFYGTDPQRADTDGDGISDGDEVRKGQNPRGNGGLFSFGL
ncbi:MAG: YD repeat protein [Candidatus Uhrbacteria bacterium GW2011_GWF2_39_13]|uniref:YD repeat protein n=1 Tax=Candidatus Uhrbacteria bacterium GW2011_GWF2_39_13 TaxID=1618995 RepID=A0A0G0QTJ6_9BACT|nr:MAG: YD repeat protein [Candidatus Uhrbacteria bacterium GW2011_GWF2_39_13]HAU66137.1 hypothetical protein [Candidatus Uhrbacteria bacterium]